MHMLSVGTALEVTWQQHVAGGVMHGPPLSSHGMRTFAGPTTIEHGLMRSLIISLVLGSLYKGYGTLHLANPVQELVLIMVMSSKDGMQG